MQIFAKKRGFTLIELLVVIAIIGILASIVLVSMGGARAKARDAKRQSDIRQVASAQEMYYGDQEAYYKAETQDGIPAISPYLSALDDPQAPTKHYKWLDNNGTGDCTWGAATLSEGEYYCAYVTLEAPATTTYMVVSQAGTKETTTNVTGYTTACGCSAVY